MWPIGMEMFALRAGHQVLDIGCGTGSQLKLIAGADLRLAGIDSSPGMLARARRKLKGAASLHAGEATKLPYRG